MKYNITKRIWDQHTSIRVELIVNSTLVGEYMIDCDQTHTLPFFHLKSLYVYEPYRNNGYGNCLLKHALDYSKQLDYDTVYIEVFKKNKHIIQWYRRNGFAVRYKLSEGNDKNYWMSYKH